MKGDPGRVVTLIPAAGRRCYGRAYLIKPGVLDHLDRREINGYERHEVSLHFDDGESRGVMYVAATNNHAFLGDASMDEMVAQIRRCAGASGTNSEYVLELAQALREIDEHDEHVFELERRLLIAGECQIELSSSLRRRPSRSK